MTATIFNQPSHGRVEGDVETWISTDGGVLWERSGVPAVHEPGTNRLNVAAGRAHDGSLVVLSSGTSNMAPRGGSTTDGLWDWLPILVSRSSDRGRTWQRSSSVELPDGVDYMIPFGDIIAGPGKTLAACAYHDRRYKRKGNPTRNVRRPTVKATSSSYLLFSKDDGETWGGPVVIGADDYNETVILPLRSDRWLAAARTVKDAHLELLLAQPFVQLRRMLDVGLKLPLHLVGRVLGMVPDAVFNRAIVRDKEGYLHAVRSPLDHAGQHGEVAGFEELMLLREAPFIFQFADGVDEEDALIDKR